MTLTKPTVGQSRGTWGAVLNAALDDLDANKLDVATDAATHSVVFNVRGYGAVGDGVTDDTAAIAAAVTAYNARGGTLYFPATGYGKFYKTTGGHVLTEAGTVCGDAGPQAFSGWGSSAVQLANGSNRSLFLVASQGITIRDLSLYGNKANQSGTSHGIECSTASTKGLNYFKLSRLWISDFLTDGIRVQTTTGSGSIGGAITNVESRLNGEHGLHIASGSDCTITDSLFDQNGASGMYATSGGLFQGVHCWGNGTDGAAADRDGVRITAGGFCRFVNCEFETNLGNGAYCLGNNNSFTGCNFWGNFRNGAYAFSNSWSQWVGCTFRNNGFSGFTDTNGAGLRLDTCTASVVSGCSFFDTLAAGFKHQTYGFAEVNASVGNRFSDNTSRAADHKTGAYVVTSAAMLDLGEFFRYKPGDQSVTSSNVIADDNDLQFPVAVGEVWQIEGTLFCDGAQTGDLNLRITTPASPTGYWRAHGPNASGTSATASSYLPIGQLFNTTQTVGLLGAGVITPVTISGLLTITTAGTVVLRWAQGTSDLTATILKAGSFLRARRVAQ